MIAVEEVTQIANEAVDQLQIAKDYLAWFDTLSWTISDALKNGRNHHAKELAGIVQYLSNNYLSFLDSDVESFNNRLSALELRT